MYIKQYTARTVAEQPVIFTPGRSGAIPVKIKGNQLPISSVFNTSFQEFILL